MGVVSKVAACVPIYDFLTAQTYAMWMLHLQVIVCAFGALSFAFTGVLQITFGLTILALVSLEVGSMKLAKVRSRAIVPDASSRRVDCVYHAASRRQGGRAHAHGAAPGARGRAGRG